MSFAEVYGGPVIPDMLAVLGETVCFMKICFFAIRNGISSGCSGKSLPPLQKTASQPGSSGPPRYSF
ncbi:MAG: hypothetical protein ACI4S4_00030 [Candidatus Ornithospirochaeta sp.]